MSMLIVLYTHASTWGLLPAGLRKLDPASTCSVPSARMQMKRNPHAAILSIMVKEWDWHLWNQENMEVSSGSVHRIIYSSTLECTFYKLGFCIEKPLLNRWCSVHRQGLHFTRNHHSLSSFIKKEDVDDTPVCLHHPKEGVKLPTPLNPAFHDYNLQRLEVINDQFLCYSSGNKSRH